MYISLQTTRSLPFVLIYFTDDDYLARFLCICFQVSVYSTVSFVCTCTYVYVCVMCVYMLLFLCYEFAQIDFSLVIFRFNFELTWFELPAIATYICIKYSLSFHAATFLIPFSFNLAAAEFMLVEFESTQESFIFIRFSLFIYYFFPSFHIFKYYLCCAVRARVHM